MFRSLCYSIIKFDILLRRITVENKRGKVTLVLMTLVLLLVLALGPVAPGLGARMAEPRGGTVEMWDGLHGLLADPSAGAGSGGG